MATMMVKNENASGDGKVMFVDTFRIGRKELPDEALRARLQDMQAAGFNAAAATVERELNLRAKRDAWEEKNNG